MRDTARTLTASPEASFMDRRLPLWAWLIALLSALLFLVTLRVALLAPHFAWETIWHDDLLNAPIPGWFYLLSLVFLIGSTVLGPAVVITAISQLARGHWQRAIVWLLSLVPSLTTYVMKAVIQRPCPLGGVNVYDVFHLNFMDTFRMLVPTTLNVSCFPSGHTTTYMAVFGLVAYVAATGMRPSYWRTVVVALCLITIVLVGIAAIALSEHQAMDVLGAYPLGAALLVPLIWLYERTASQPQPGPREAAK